MIDRIFGMGGRRRRDLAELAQLIQRHGPHTPAILKLRATDPRLDPRSRRHWRRLERLV